MGRGVFLWLSRPPTRCWPGRPEPGAVADQAVADASADRPAATAGRAGRLPWAARATWHCWAAATPGLHCGAGLFTSGHAAWIHALRQHPGGGRFALPAGAGRAVSRGIRRLERLPVATDRQGPASRPRLQHGTARDVAGSARFGSGRTAAGGALFLLSDTLLALEKFAGIHLPAHEGVVMATYTTAQALLASPPPDPARTAGRLPQQRLRGPRDRRPPVAPSQRMRGGTGPREPASTAWAREQAASAIAPAAPGYRGGQLLA